MEAACAHSMGLFLLKLYARAQRCQSASRDGTPAELVRLGLARYELQVCKGDFVKPATFESPA